jgi:hypothetical protein
MVNTSADDDDTIVDDQPIMLPEQGQEMRKHTLCPQPSAPATWAQIAEHRPRPRTPGTQPLSCLENLGRVTPQTPRLVVLTL